MVIGLDNVSWTPGLETQPILVKHTFLDAFLLESWRAEESLYFSLTGNRAIDEAKSALLLEH